MKYLAALVSFYLVAGIFTIPGNACASEEFVNDSTVEDGVSREIAERVGAILEENVPERRQDLTASLLLHIHRIASEQKLSGVSDDAIVEIEKLLEDEYTASLACRILAEFGARAQAAVPAIEEAISEMELRQRLQLRNVIPSMDSASAMREQLARIEDSIQ